MISFVHAAKTVAVHRAARRGIAYGSPAEKQAPACRTRPREKAQQALRGRCKGYSPKGASVKEADGASGKSLVPPAPGATMEAAIPKVCPEEWTRPAPATAAEPSKPGTIRANPDRSGPGLRPLRILPDCLPGHYFVAFSAKNRFYGDVGHNTGRFGAFPLPALRAAIFPLAREPACGAA